MKIGGFNVVRYPDDSCGILLVGLFVVTVERQNVSIVHVAVGIL